MKDPEQIRPPAWANDFLEWFCAPHLLEEIQGDLHEVFHKRCRERGVRKAKILFALDVLASVSLRTIDKSFRTNTVSATMISNFFKLGWRNFTKYMSYSLINIFGLSIGFSSALLLFLIIRYENSFDGFHSKADRIYRVGNSYKDGNFDDMIVTPQVPLMEKEYPEIVHSSRFHGSEDILGHGDVYTRSSYHVVDPGFGELFEFPMIAGDLRKALASPNQIVLTQSTARQLFGENDPMGKTVRLVNEKIEFTVAAIAADPPKNSTLWFQALIPWANAPKWLDLDQAGNWYNTFMIGYIEVAPGTSKDDLEQKLLAFRDTHFLEERRETWSILLLPLKDEHFRLSENKRMITIFSIMAGAILLVSCINFTNLSIAQTLNRTKEVGLRRVLGSLRHHISVQFSIEAAITCAIALVFGIALAWFVLPHLNHYYDIDVSINLRENYLLVALLAGICVLPVLCASIGPSFALARLQPANAMRSVIKHGNTGESLRRGLIVVQFTVSMVLLIGTAIVWEQTNYMKSQDLRFNKANVIAIDAWPEFFKDPEKAKLGFLTFRDQLNQQTAIESVAFTSNIPGQYDENYNVFRPADASDDEFISLRQIYVDHNFFQTFGMRIVRGRSFSPELDKGHAVIINEAAMKKFGWTDIDNKELIGNGMEQGTSYKVVGVVEDYYYQSLKRSIQPLIHFYIPDNVARMAVRLKAGRIDEGLDLLRNHWNAMDAYGPFDYRFVDKSFDALYKEQDRLSATASLFSLIAIIVSCLGLFSITAYSIHLRRKEVSIRKVLGASVLQVVLKLSRAYGLMIGIGFLVACPIVYYLGNNFLSSFEYRIELSPITFVSVGVATFLLAMLVVGYLSSRAASENPVNALKEE